MQDKNRNLEGKAIGILPHLIINILRESIISQKFNYDIKGHIQEFENNSWNNYMEENENKSKTKMLSVNDFLLSQQR